MGIIQLIEFLLINNLASISEDGTLLAATGDEGPVGRISIEKLNEKCKQISINFNLHVIVIIRMVNQ